MNDRIVHAEGPGGSEQIVRYDRAGKWYIELPVEGLRKHVGIGEAARRAMELRDYFGGVIHYGLPGGRAFAIRLPPPATRSCSGESGVGSQTTGAGGVTDKDLGSTSPAERVTPLSNAELLAIPVRDRTQVAGTGGGGPKLAPQPAAPATDLWQEAFEHPDHLCNGMCPDEPGPKSPGMESRDPECFYCNVMVALDALTRSVRLW